MTYVRNNVHILDLQFIFVHTCTCTTSSVYKKTICAFLYVIYTFIVESVKVNKKIKIFNNLFIDFFICQHFFNVRYIKVQCMFLANVCPFYSCMIDLMGFYISVKNISLTMRRHQL